MSCKVLHKEGRDFMRGSLEGGVVVVASDWCWSISCSTAAALTRKAGGRPLRRRRAPRSQSRKAPRSATTPKAPPASGGGAPSSVCENLYQSHQHAAAGARLHVRIISQARKWSHGRAPRNHACGNARRWEKLYHQTLTNAFLKKLHRDCQCLDFCP